jgi:ribosomal protein L28
MKRTFDRSQIGPMCLVCGKTTRLGVNKPHSQKRTKRLVKPNVQSYYGLMLCTRCLRTLKLAQNSKKAELAAASQ